jgi:TRAP-type C4-dicarboxylate transport system permease small subunit
MVERTLSSLLRALKWVVIAIFAVMIAATFLQVICRYVLEAPLSWSEELSRYCFVWIVFLAAVIGLDRGALLGVDILTRRLPIVLQYRVALLCEILMGAFCMAVAYASVPVIKANALQSSPAIGLPMSWVYSVIPISMVLMVLVLVLRRAARSAEGEPAP